MRLVNIQKEGRVPEWVNPELVLRVRENDDLNVAQSGKRTRVVLVGGDERWSELDGPEVVARLLGREDADICLECGQPVGAK